MKRILLVVVIVSGLFVHTDLLQAETANAEKKIAKALDSNVELELDDTTTFEELIVMIQDRFPGINVALDPKAEVALQSAIAEESIRYHGIKLRSALRLLLSEHDMTYVIRNEVLLLTSEEWARNTTPSGYPISDLIVDRSETMKSKTGSSVPKKCRFKPFARFRSRR